MTRSLNQIPERIEQGEQQFLNCEIGSDTKPNSDADSLVLTCLENALADSFLQTYYRYPDFSRNQENDYLDIVAINPDIGLSVIEIYNFELNEIEQIEGPDWYLKDSPKPIRPPSIPNNGKVAIRYEIEQRAELTDEDNRSIIPCHSHSVLPNITSEEFDSEYSQISTEKIIFEDELLDRDILFSKLTDSDSSLTDKNLRDTLAVLKFSNAISGEQLNTAATPESKRELLERIDQRLKVLTDKQLEIGLQTPDTPQQIRGIAGSGKTVVTAFRAARLHWQNEDWNIAVTFRNRGLRQTLKQLIAKFYRQFSEGEDYNEDKLDIFHAWGGATPGMYSTIASKVDGVNPLTWTQAKHKYRYKSDKFAACCREVLNGGEIPEMYDAVLIDEGQDLPNSFFKMCYRACTKEKRIYWSYDEAQSLGNLEATDAEKLFGKDEAGNQLVDLSGTTEGGYNKSQVMRTSFRTPRSILMTAHGFGMGMYREGPPVQVITTKRGWDYVGYDILEGDFKESGNEVILSRDISRSPHPLWEYQSPSDLITEYWADTREDEIMWVIDDIERLVKDEDVKPEEIMITFLWTYDIREENLKRLIDGLKTRFDKDIVNDVSHITRKKGIRGRIKQDEKISVTNIYHSRGNQAPFVYVMGMDMVAEETSKELTAGREKQWRQKHVDLRNQAFVGFTRTQGWLKISGTDPTNRIVGELNRVLADTQSESPKLSMEVPPEDSPFKDLDPEDNTSTNN